MIVQRQPKLVTSEEDRRAVESLLLRTSIGGNPFVIIHPGARKTAACWPPERFASIIQAVLERGLGVVLIGGAEERPVADLISSMVPKTFADLVGKLSVSRLIALMERCCLFIGNESGPMHVAAASGAPIVAIFGTNSPLRWGPLCADHTIVRPAMPCSCEFPQECRPPSPTRTFCIRRNCVVDVLAAIDAQLSRASRPAEPRTAAQAQRHR
ncbi:MAG: hypothetical protein GEU95_23980 [Rhizobiales bacterium]|nr:hypothetical protein [Hyphomicrobiales bacterium]